MDITLKNEFLTIKSTEKGAELTSIKGNNDNIEYLWTADEDIWSRHAPILFPIVGKVNNNTYRVEDKVYNLSQHGFARDVNFEVIENSKEKALFRLCWSEESLKKYPYKFQLDVLYTLNQSTLDVSYRVKNVDDKDIYFSIGAHPGFNCPLDKEADFQDYYFEFDNKETAGIVPINKDGLLKRKHEPLLKDSNILPISKELFKNDALVFDNLKSKRVSLKNNKNSKGINFEFHGFPCLGLWSKPTGAPFVCIEPWFGHADFEDFEGDFREKEGILKLNKDEEFNCKYSITIIQ